MEYKIFRFQSVFSSTKATEQLTKAVNEAIALGWEPIGGVTVTDQGIVAQAMVKRR